ncbi:MAG: hypothetical protein M5R36_02240 [Deltaproteobacteria bacterium]|nr:hypothetical protein [Deltaproteobacteria bacterium]
MAVKTLIDEEEVDRTVKWKVREEGAGIDDEDLPALLETAPEGA